MNNKILRKLTLSAVTLGVAAVSATTSTFAWFTTNSKVSASEISGTVSSATGNMLVSVKKDGSWKAAAKTVELPTGSTSLTPVTVASETKDSKTTYEFKKAGDTPGTFTKDTTDNTDYIHYELVFYMSDLSSANGIKNVLTANFNKFVGGNGSQYLLVDASGEESGAKAGDTIKVDLLDVLSMRVESTILTENLSTYGISDTVTGVSTSNIASNTTKFYQYNTESDNVKVGESDKKADALTYYNKVHSTSLERTNNTPTYETTKLSATDNSSDSTKAGIELFEVSGTSKAYVKTDIYFFIDGWDKQCFNAVGGLQITAGTIEFNLTTANTASN